ncbi:MAG: hypothetical protein GX589_04815 [Deltaproteobacteria bacterium]|nr:hypothetical protein [Deltaproteobacteria bacterium]
MRPRIARSLSDTLGLEVNLAELDFSVYPTPGLRAKGLSITPPGSCAAAVKAEELILILDYAALLNRKLHVSMLKILEPSAAISLESGKPKLKALDGLTTPYLKREGQDLCQMEEPSMPSSTPKSAAPAITHTSSSPLDFSIAVETVTLSRAKLELLQSGRKYELFLEEFRTDLDWDDETLTLNAPTLSGKLDQNPLNFNASRLELNVQTKMVAIKNAELKLNKFQLRADAQLRNWCEPERGQISSTSIDLPQLSSLINRYSPKSAISSIKTGKLAFDLNFSGGPQADLLTGKLSLTDFNLPSYPLTLRSLALDKFSLRVPSNGAWSLDTPLRLQNFTIKDLKDAYQLERGSGSISIKMAPNKQLNATGNLALKGFGFNDGTTKITNIDADLSKIAASVSPQGSITVTLDLAGKSLDLDHDAVTIRGFSSLKAPLKIEVPAHGGYLISGPVSVSGAKITTLKRDFRDVSANVGMLISKPLRRFTSQNLSAELMGRRLALKTDFSMEPNAYVLGASSISMPPAVLNLSGKIDRDSARTFAVELAGEDLLPAELTPLILPEQKEQFEGTIKSLNAKLTGTMHNPLDSLSGEGDFLITKPIATRFDLTASIIDAVSMLPVIGGVITPSRLKEPDNVHRTRADFAVSKRLVTISNLKMERKRFTLYGKGTVDFDLKVNAKGSVVFLRETFGGFSGGFEAFGELLGRVGKIEVPLFARGTYPDISVTPDTVTFLKDNSGLTLMGKTLGAAKDVGVGVGRFITRPFRGKKKPQPQ